MDFNNLNAAFYFEIWMNGDVFAVGFFALMCLTLCALFVILVSVRSTQFVLPFRRRKTYGWIMPSSYWTLLSKIHGLRKMLVLRRLCVFWLLLNWVVINASYLHLQCFPIISQQPIKCNLNPKQITHIFTLEKNCIYIFYSNLVECWLVVKKIDFLYGN